MFKVKKFGEVTRIMMATEIEGKVIFSVCAYLIDGLLIDTGPHKTRWELVNFLRGQEISLVVNTHHHVDHVGGNKAIWDVLKVPVFASPECLSIIDHGQDIFSYQKELWGLPEPFCHAKALHDTVKTNHFCFDVINPTTRLTINIS